MTSQDANEMRDRRVLHVLPHPGGGGETYADALSTIDGYRAERAYLSARVAPLSSVPSVVWNAARLPWVARPYDVLHVHGEIASAACLPSLAVSPSVVTLHGLHLLRRAEGALRLGAEVNLRLIVRAATKTICVSEAEHAEVVGIVGSRAARKKLVVIHNGVAPPPPPSQGDRAAVRAELGISEEAVVGVSVGGLDEHKDPLTAVRAAIAAVGTGADLALVVVGDGPLRCRLEEAVRGGGADVVHVTGYRPDASRILAAADFFVLSSLREGFSYALLEAMSLGLPAVVSDAPGNPEAVGDTGLVVPCSDVAGFAAAFERLARHGEERARLGASAKNRATTFFHLGGMLRRTRSVYEEVRGAHRASS